MVDGLNHSGYTRMKRVDYLILFLECAIQDQ